MSKRINSFTAFIPVASLVIIFLCAEMNSHAEGLSQTRIRKWEPAIQEFERQDAADALKPGGVVFVGSSSIRRWNLSKWFGDEAPLNRGFGGSQIADVNHFIERTVLKHKPRMIVFYAGDNDIASGRRANAVAEDFATFCTRVHKDLPDTKIVFISIKPSPRRWHLAAELMLANQRISQLCKADDKLVYLDVWTPMLAANGEPRPELFAKDKLHLNDAGYELWTKRIKPYLPG